VNEFDANVPIYLQIMREIKRAVVTGELKPGDRLPSVRERAEALTVNPNTVQRAYQELEREGVSETRRGTGSFIVERNELIGELRVEMAGTVITAFIEGMRSLGFADGAMVERLEKELRDRGAGGAAMAGGAN